MRSIVLTIICLTCSFLVCCTNTQTTKSDDNVKLTVVNEGKKVHVEDKDGLISLIEKYARLGEDRLLNKSISNSEIKKIGKSGLKIELRFTEYKRIPVFTDSDDENVCAIYVLEDTNHILVVDLDDARLVFSLNENEINKIYTYVFG